MAESLSPEDLHADPLHQLELWLDAVRQAQLPEPQAMTLATADDKGRPAARIVLLRRINASGLCFYTNYQSRKGEDMHHNPAAALLFFWPQLERQVRVEGRIEKTSAAESDEYFNSRPYLSRIGAWASDQSRPIDSRKVLDRRVAELCKKYPEGSSVPRPPHWGGYRLVPGRFEFWQGRPNRLHDRFVYLPRKTGWTIQRLAP